jgi:Ca-activated chloride channel homolog
MKFALPWFLLLYLPFIGLVIYALKTRKPTILIPSIKPFRKANPGKKLPLSSGLPFLLTVLAMACMIFALARPQHGIDHMKQKAEGIDIMLAIDLSGSMEAIDVPERYREEKEVYKALQKGVLKSRITIAKAKIREFIEDRPNDRIGLIAFAPLPYVACPPTLDHTWLYAHLDRLKAGVIGDATGIAGPIAAAVHRLKTSDSKRKVLVLFTDGSNNIDARVTPRQAAKLAKTFDVIIYTVGIGSRNAYVVQKHPFYGKVLRPLGSQFDEKLMKDIAEISDGQYYTAADEKGLKRVMKEIDKLEKTTKEQPRYIDYSDIGPLFVQIALGMILAAFGLGQTFLLRIP